MAEVSFFMMPQDSREFAQVLIDEFDAKFVLDGSDSSRIVQLDNADDIARSLDPDGYPARFFVVSKYWTAFPLQFIEIHHDDGRHRWYVRQRYGGPAFDFASSKIISMNSQRQLIAGSFADYPWYYLQIDSPERHRRPNSMVDAFKRVRQHLRQNGERTRSVGDRRLGPWAMRHALREIEDTGLTLRIGDDRFAPFA
jgi:hypothetical protein